MRIPDECWLRQISGNCWHLVNLRKPWARIRTKAGLSDVRIHDLRHSFASVGAALGLSLPMIGKMLEHNHAATTQRYAHLAAHPIKNAVDKIGATIATALHGNRNGAGVPTIHGNTF